MIDTKPSRPPLNAFSRGALKALDEIEMRVIGTDEDREALYRFRYECYHAAGHVPACESRQVRDAFDDVPGTMCFALYHKGRIASSVRLHCVTRRERRSMSVATFPDVLEPMLDMGFELLDPTRFTVDPGLSRELPALPYLTLRLIVMASTHFGSDYALSLVRGTHGAFYRRIFGAAQMGEPRRCDSVDFPVCLYASDLALRLPVTYTRYPFFRSLAAERKALFGGVPEETQAVRPTAALALNV